ncbi:hypothetical protein VFPPC_18145 [Pochonia chlamydosporia 170]|uniref:Secreted protein n=1 Tax=Pochonia chlamydosporia 170 TaxID=1380566 RepID=A0A219AQ81_METCM|nr:hypothetical protein VFPPC_18145 [Pochonia chlamydosporia 170]OWT42732.1 hypothetical protein VFPPC_18145 [Pochonia chlamydosporia 170]
MHVFRFTFTVTAKCLFLVALFAQPVCLLPPQIPFSLLLEDRFVAKNGHVLQSCCTGFHVSARCLPPVIDSAGRLSHRVLRTTQHRETGHGWLPRRLGFAGINSSRPACLNV